jgi:hypothetical protein
LNLEQSKIWECLTPFGPEFYIFLFAMESTMQSIILPVVSYGGITWFLMLREQHRVRIFEKRVLMKMFVAKGGGIRGDWSELLSGSVMALIH